ncbi:IclR family transcriptional regulator [Pararhizobium mangrovi]|uniref:IclR family transcriptional regulator n=2 Tax=Pararhizobium mangrovi TaxID=2590452 RepID=A0A506U3U8_9HYPH|nr:IclR family transcriptional regulator [Pararhizobium mangrovi]
MQVARRPGCGVSEIARRVGETKAKTFRLLRTLERHAMVFCDASHGYRLGDAILVLGTAASGQIDLVKLASPIMEDLGLKVNETVQLRLRDDAEALCIAKFEPSRDLRVHAVIGRRRPLYAGSSKAILAFLPPAERDRQLPEKLIAFTRNTLTRRDQLEEEVRRIRAGGYCVSRGEVSDQLVSVSAPVFAIDGSIIACLNIAAPSFRTQDSDINRFIKLVTQAAASVSRGLGYTG